MITLSQSPTFYLAGAGTIVGATNIVLTNLTDIYNNVLTMSDFGSRGFITLEPDTNNEESATFTSITANSNGTYTLGGVKTALAISPYTETSGLIRQHSGGTKVVLSDTTALWNTFANKENNETITGNWTFNSFPAVPGVLDNASSIAKGITYLSVDPVSATDPIAVGDNDPRMVSSTPTRQKFSSTGTWTKPAGLRYVIVEVVGGGGGGGGAESAANNTNGSGGGGGGYSRKLILEAALGGTETVTIGDGGTAGADTGGDGGNGGDTTFGAHCTGGGGKGGYGDDGDTRLPGFYGEGSGGDLNLYGDFGGIWLPNTGANCLSGGNGGNSMFGIGGLGQNAGLSSTAGRLHGGGGAGALSISTAQAIGGTGTPGYCIVTEYY